MQFEIQKVSKCGTNLRTPKQVAGGAHLAKIESMTTGGTHNLCSVPVAAGVCDRCELVQVNQRAWPSIRQLSRGVIIISRQQAVANGRGVCVQLDRKWQAKNTKGQEMWCSMPHVACGLWHSPFAKRSLAWHTT